MACGIYEKQYETKYDTLERGRTGIYKTFYVHEQRYPDGERQRAESHTEMRTRESTQSTDSI